MTDKGRYRFHADEVTDVGQVRKHNEDNCLSDTARMIWAVADGMGGHESGEVASAAIVAALAVADLGAGRQAGIHAALAATNADLRRRAVARGPGAVIASTAVVMTIEGDRFLVLWAGDSRLYVLRAGRLLRITTDHSLVQELVEAGAIAPEDAEDHPQANVITRAIGVDDELELDMLSDQLQPGDRFLLCSDGLYRSVSESEIARIMGTHHEGGAARVLVDLANENGARDNVTAVVVATEIEDEDEETFRVVRDGP